MKKNDKTKLLLIEVPIEFHAEIKAMAALRNISIKKLIMRLLYTELKRLEEYK